MRWLVAALAALAAVLLAGCGGSSKPHVSAKAAPPRAHTSGACASEDCGPGGIVLYWSNLNFPSTTGYYLTVDGTQVRSATSSPYTLYGMGCGTTFTLGVQAHDASSRTSQVFTTSYTTPACTTRFSPLEVAGNQLENQSGKRVVLHGVNRAGTEYSCIHGDGFFDGTGSSFSQEDAQIKAMASWGINSEMITLNEDCWLGINRVPAAYSNSSSSPPMPGCSASQCPYANAIENLVVTDEANGIYPVLSLFAAAPGANQSVGHIDLADNDHAPLFWEEVADFFKDDPYVIFRVEQEPEMYYAPESNWECWAQGDVSYGRASDNAPPTAPTSTGRPDMCNTLTGGNAPEYNGSAYDAVGMQSLVNIVRGTGAPNIIMLPGLAYANMWSCGVGTSPSSCGALASATPPITDPHSPARLMAEADVYPEGNSCGSPSCYKTVFKPIAQAMPFVAGEMGENPANGYYPTTGVDTLMNWLDSNGSGYFPYAWDWWAHLIPGYGNNSSPKSWWGTDYYDHINGITPPSPSQPTDGITFPWSLPSDCVGLSNGSLSPVATSPAVSAGDDLFAVFAGHGYDGTAGTVTGVSDKVNGAWTSVEQSGDQSLNYNGNAWHASYSVFELVDSKAAPGGLTLTINGRTGQSGASGVVFDVRGVASVRASSFQSKINRPSSTRTGPTLSGVPANDVVLGLWGGYSADETYTAPSGWNTHPNWWVSSADCAAAAMDWTQPSRTGKVTPSISLLDSSGDEDYYAGAIDLHP
jgi:hypothetical protein